jgi:hypothetical protein
MSITLNEKDVNVFKLYDEMVIAYSNDIEGYKAMIAAIEGMIAQKQSKLQAVKDKTIELIKTSLETIPSKKTPLQRKAEKFNYAGIDIDALSSGKEIASGQAVVEATQPIAAKKQSKAITASIQVQSPKPARHKKTTGKGKVKKAEKPKKPALRSKDIPVESNGNQLGTSLKKISKAKSKQNITATCLYHPKSPVLDKARQLCSSCKWKLITNGLKHYDKDPAVISFLKGETTKLPDLGQSMCPIHPAVPSYNQKTGLCKSCQKKAKEIGVSDRHLTTEELNVLRNPLS